MSRQVQTQAVLDYMRRAPITSMEALRALGCFRLAARIYDLREAGHDIGDFWIEVRKADGTRVNVKQYYLRSKETCEI